MARPADSAGLSPSEFLAWERLQPTRHEYFRGEVFAMAGGSMRHNALCLSVGAALLAIARACGCAAWSSDQRVGIGAGERYVYPDGTLACGGVRVEPGTRDVLANPTVIVEVLSASTEAYDRGLKWDGYQRIPSLTDYLLVSQTEARIEQFQRQTDGRWLYRAARSGEHVLLAQGSELDVDAIFAGAFELPGDTAAAG